MLNCNSLAARESMCCTQLVSATQSGLNYCDTFTLCVCFELKRIQLLLFFNLSLLNSLDTPCTHHVARLIHYSWETNNILVLVPNTYQAAHHHLICADFLLFGIHGWMYWDRSDTLQHKQSRCRLQWGICMMHCFFFVFLQKLLPRFRSDSSLAASRRYIKQQPSYFMSFHSESTAGQMINPRVM